MSEIILDKDEFPIKGHSSVKVYGDEKCWVAFGKGNTYNDGRPMASVHLLDIDLKVYGGRNFKEYLEANTTANAYDATWRYLLNQNPKELVTVIANMFKEVKTKAIREGRKQKALEIRNCLHAD